MNRQEQLNSVVLVVPDNVANSVETNGFLNKMTLSQELPYIKLFINIGLYILHVLH